MLLSKVWDSTWELVIAKGRLQQIVDLGAVTVCVGCKPQSGSLEVVRTKESWLLLRATKTNRAQNLSAKLSAKVILRGQLQEMNCKVV